MYFSLVSTLFTAPLHLSVDHMRSLFQKLLRNGPLSLLLTLVALIAGFASVHFFRFSFWILLSNILSSSTSNSHSLYWICCSLAHPYLLADNRHYPFYLWRKVINAHWLMKYMLVPVYVYSWFSILTLLGMYKPFRVGYHYLFPPFVWNCELDLFFLNPTAKTRRKIWVLVYFLATFGVLVPTPLIEFRYYTVPFYLFMLHSSVRSSGCATWLLIGTIFVCINVFTMAMFLFRPFKWSHEDGVQRFIW